MTETLRIPLEGSVAPGHEVLLVRGDSRPFALSGEWAGGGVLVGSNPVEVASPEADPFDLLGGARRGQTGPDDSVGSFVGGGWFGYLGFGLGVPGETRVVPPPSGQELPGFCLARYDHLLHLDSNRQWWFEALLVPGREEAISKRLETLRKRIGDGIPDPGTFRTADWETYPTPKGHALAVEACRERISAGDLYQANLALRLHSSIEGDPIDLFATAVKRLSPDRAAFFADEDLAVASLSPELFLERHGSKVRSAPIKGTRPRDRDPGADLLSRDELANSPKDHAENTMIVDLVRNDLGRVCVPGSVEVTALAEPRPHTGVWHLVSEVEGEMLPGVDDADLLAASFPPGSVTGAPKLAALETICSLESSARQVFTGAIGFASPFAGLELNVAIRTFEVRGEEIWLDVGGGVVADSEPDGEAIETLTKARPLLEAIGACLGENPATSGAPTVLRLGSRPVSRPDPEQGLFETLRVSAGKPVNAEGHLDRLRSSVRELMGVDLPSDAEHLIANNAATLDSGRMRIDFIPGEGLEFQTSPLPSSDGPIKLVAVTVPGGLGAHKWRDRRLLESLTRAVAPAVPLLVDLDGSVLEAAWASVFSTDGNGDIATPPLDGRILPGIGRARWIEELRLEGSTVTERPIALTELSKDEVTLVNSLRGEVPAVLVVNG